MPVVYAKSLVVFALSTIFVLGFVLVLNYEAAGVMHDEQNTISSQSSCTVKDTSCVTFSITYASLRNVNYASSLGPANYTTLMVGVNASGSTPLTRINLFVGNTSAGSVDGPFEPGVNRLLNLTLPATVTVSPGKTYLLSVEGFYGSGMDVWETEEVAAQ